jgi:tryptophan synthase alpha chain
VMDMVREFRTRDVDTPVVLMGYLNPVEIMGYQAFAEAAAGAGVDGLLTVDLPPEEGHDLVEALRSNDIDPIYLLAPTSNESRIARICAAASGFVYYVSLKGVTGAATLNVDEVGRRVAAIRAHTDLPVGVGFGIRDAESAARVAAVADAVVVGSALVNRIAEYENDPEAGRRAVSELLAGMRKAMG